MARIPDAIAKNIQQFMIAVQQRRQVETAYLYESYVKGVATKWSDIDLAIVSPDFSDNLFQEQLALMLLAANIDNCIEPRPFIPEDFNINEPLVNEIQQTGISLKW